MIFTNGTIMIHQASMSYLKPLIMMFLETFLHGSVHVVIEAEVGVS